MEKKKEEKHLVSTKLNVERYRTELFTLLLNMFLLSVKTGN